MGRGQGELAIGMTPPAVSEAVLDDNSLSEFQRIATNLSKLNKMFASVAVETTVVAVQEAEIAKQPTSMPKKPDSNLQGSIASTLRLLNILRPPAEEYASVAASQDQNVELGLVPIKEAGNPIDWLAELVRETDYIEKADSGEQQPGSSGTLDLQAAAETSILTVQVQPGRIESKRRSLRIGGCVRALGSLVTSTVVGSLFGALLPIGYIKGSESSIDAGQKAAAAQAPRPTTQSAAAGNDTINTIDTAPTTTEFVLPASYMEQVNQGYVEFGNIWHKKIGTVEIPDICLNNVNLTASARIEIDDPLTQQYLLERGYVNAEELAIIQSGNYPYQLEADIKQRYGDPIYGLQFIADSNERQKPCLMPGESEYPSRWESQVSQSGSTASQEFVNNGTTLDSLQPNMDIISSGVMVGQEGNAVFSCHRNTESGTCKNLDALLPGQSEIKVYGDNGTVYAYTVESIESESLTASNDAELWNKVLMYQSPSGINKTLTIVTCDDGGDKRLIIRAILTSESPYVIV